MTDLEPMYPTRDTLVLQSSESAGEWIETDCWVELPAADASPVLRVWRAVLRERRGSRLLLVRNAGGDGRRAWFTWVQV